MQIRHGIAVLLLSCATVSAAHGQQTSTSALQSADRAFADALIHHDRGAFVAMFAPDSESTLPVLKRGPEAIADAWLPLLIDPGTTMIFTNVDVTADESGDTGTSSGTFAIEGRTQGGVKTIPRRKVHDCLACHRRALENQQTRRIP